MPKLGPWMPDQGPSIGVTDVDNARPIGTDGWGKVEGLGEYSNAAPNGYLRGVVSGKDNSGNNIILAGDEGDLLKYNASDANLDVVSKAGGYTLTTEDMWDFVTFGDVVIGCHGFNDILQSYQLGVSSLFADIAGSPQAKYMAVVKDQVMTANVNYGGNNYPFRLYWSALNDHTGWTIGTNQSDIQDLADSGHITGIVGGQEGVIFCERAIWRANYVGAPLIFQFDQADVDNGCRLPGSIVSLSPTEIYYFSNQGFKVWNGQAAISIGAEMVDKFFIDDLNSSYQHRVSATINTRTREVMWSYPDQDSTDGTPNKILIYNYVTKRWGKICTDHDRLATIITAATSIESLDALFGNLDAIPGSLDDAIYRGGQFLAAASLNSKIATFNEAALAATIITTEFQLAGGRAGQINGMIPNLEATSSPTDPVISAALGVRTVRTQDPTFYAAMLQNGDGICPIRGSARYNRIKLSITGEWDLIHDFELLTGRSARRRR